MKPVSDTKAIFASWEIKWTDVPLPHICPMCGTDLKAKKARQEYMRTYMKKRRG